MLWLKGLLKELRVLGNETMMFHCDNVVASNIANNPVQFDRINMLRLIDSSSKKSLIVGF